MMSGMGDHSWWYLKITTVSGGRSARPIITRPTRLIQETWTFRVVRRQQSSARSYIPATVPQVSNVFYILIQQLFTMFLRCSLLIPLSIGHVLLSNIRVSRFDGQKKLKMQNNLDFPLSRITALTPIVRLKKESSHK